MDVIAKTGGFEQGMDRAARTAKQRSDNIRRSVSRIGKAFAAVTVAAAGALAVFVRQTINTADQISKLSQTTGISTEALSQLGFAADLSGVSLETVSTGMARLARTASDAARGLAAPQRAFDALGISVQDIDGSLKDTDELLLDVAERFSQLEDGAAKAAVAQELFGRAGVNMIPFLNQGREGIAALSKEADELGLTIFPRTGKEAEAFNDNIARLRAVFAGLVNQFTQAILPTLVRLSELFVQNAKASSQFNESSEELATGLKLLATSGTLVTSSFNVLGKVLGGTVAALAAIDQYEFRQAGRILKETFSDYASGLDQAVQDIEKIWDDATTEIVKDAVKADKALKETLIFAVDDGGGGESKLEKQADKALDTIRNLTAGIEQQIATYDLGAAAAIAYRIQVGDLANTFEMAGAAAEPYKQTLITLTKEHEQLLEATKAAAEAQAEHEAVMARGQAITESLLTPLERYQRAIEELNQLLEAGAIAHDTYERAVEGAQDRLQDATEEMSVFRDQAMRNTQDIISDALVNGFDEGAKGILESFKRMIDQLVAQALAAKLAEKLFGTEGGDEGGGLIGQIAGFFGGGRQSGGAVAGGHLFRVNESGVEALRIPGRADYLLTGNQSGEVIPNNRITHARAANVTQNIIVQGRPDTRTAQQLELEASRRQRLAVRRLG